MPRNPSVAALATAQWISIVRTPCVVLPGKVPRGHNSVRDVIFDVTKQADTTAKREVLGLLDSAPGLRPFDFTSAVLPSLT